MESLLDWGQFIKLAVAGMVMVCITWWSFEVGSFLAGTCMVGSLISLRAQVR